VCTCSIQVSGEAAESLLSGGDESSGEPSRPPGAPAPRPARLAAPAAREAVRPRRPPCPVPGGAQLLPQEVVAGDSEGAQDAQPRRPVSPAWASREGELLTS
jgi:hypothetical protein